MGNLDSVPLLFRHFFFFFFFFFLSLASATENNCSVSFCGKKNTVIEFPFRLKHRQPPSCGYPGFDVDCNGFGQTIYQLSSGGDDQLFIREIDYVTQEIRAYDPENCLPRRLLKLNLSGSPFRGVYYQNYTFLNCSSESIMSTRVTTIACLSTSTHLVIATASMALTGLLSGSCETITTVFVPVAMPVQFEDWFSSDLHDDLRLTWREPDCGDCKSLGGNCGIKDRRKSLQVGCFDIPQPDHPRAGRENILTGLALGLGLPAFVLTLVLVIYFCLRTVVRDRASGGPQQPNRATAASAVAPQPAITMGLDGPTIDSYPKVVLGESCRLPRPDDGTCPICLSEYRAKETLKLIPECQHCFHVECIDEWLYVNSACPVCRNSPSPTAAT